MDVADTTNRDDNGSAKQTSHIPNPVDDNVQQKPNGDEYPDADIDGDDVSPVEEEPLKGKEIVKLPEGAIGIGNGFESIAPTPSSARAVWFRCDQAQLKLDEMTQSVVRTGNHAQILLNGKESYHHRETNIAEADIIMAKYYQIDDDDTGRRFVQLLREAGERGATVILHYDVKVAFTLFKLIFIYLRRQKPIPPVLLPLDGAKNVILVPVKAPRTIKRLYFSRDHEKYLITWKRGQPAKMIMGGMNISNAWKTGADPHNLPDWKIKYRDTDVEIIGPVVEAAVRAFMCETIEIKRSIAREVCWNVITEMTTNKELVYEVSPQNSAIRFVINRPHLGRRGQYIEKLYLALLEMVPAGQTIRMANAYFLPNRRIKHAMINAANRGVKFEVMINAATNPEFESSIMGQAARRFFRRVLRRTTQPDNFNLYCYHGHPTIGTNDMHQKIASFGDDGPISIQSSGMDSQSLVFNVEDLALIDSEEIRLEFDKFWLADIHNTHINEAGIRVEVTHHLTKDELFGQGCSSRCSDFCLRGAACIL